MTLFITAFYYYYCWCCFYYRFFVNTLTIVFFEEHADNFVLSMLTNTLSTFLLTNTLVISSVINFYLNISMQKTIRKLILLCFCTQYIISQLLLFIPCTVQNKIITFVNILQNNVNK